MKENGAASQISEEGATNPYDSNFASANLDDVDLYQDKIKHNQKSPNTTTTPSSSIPKSANTFQRGVYKREQNNLQRSGQKTTEYEKQ